MKYSEINPSRGYKLMTPLPEHQIDGGVWTGKVRDPDIVQYPLLMIYTHTWRDGEMVLALTSLDGVAIAIVARTNGQYDFRISLQNLACDGPDRYHFPSNETACWEPGDWITYVQQWKRCCERLPDVQAELVL